VGLLVAGSQTRGGVLAGITTLAVVVAYCRLVGDVSLRFPLQVV
jgi:hypothetical protein